MCPTPAVRLFKIWIIAGMYTRERAMNPRVICRILGTRLCVHYRVVELQQANTKFGLEGGGSCWTTLEEFLPDSQRSG